MNPLKFPLKWVLMVNEALDCRIVVVACFGYRLETPDAVVAAAVVGCYCLGRHCRLDCLGSTGAHRERWPMVWMIGQRL